MGIQFQAIPIAIRRCTNYSLNLLKVSWQDVSVHLKIFNHT